MDLGRKTVLFRAVNDCIDELLDRFGAEEEADFLCECPSARCGRRVPMTRGEFERVRARGGFVLALDCARWYEAADWTSRYVVVTDFRPPLAVA